MEDRGVEYVAVKRGDNMVKSEEERLHYAFLSRMRRVIETRFSQLEELGLRFVCESRLEERSGSKGHRSRTSLQRIPDDEGDLMGTRVE